jgi:endonuclease/exonuclease/phosphatase family metal-dependent hydrolase
MKKLLLSLLITTLSFANTHELTTYNLGLAHTYVPFASQRTQPLIDALKKQESDVLCLQEVWKKEDRNLIINSLKSEYPYAHFTKIFQERASKKPVCKVKELFGKDKFVTCTLKKCKKLDGDDFTNCVINKCGDSLVRLKNSNRQCAAALMAQVGKSSTASIWAVINPFKKASLFTYGGSNGLLLLSKKKMTEKSLLNMSDISALSRRSALKAKIEDVGNIYCTHLSANLAGEAPYAGKFESWEEENFAQAERLVTDALDQQGPTALLGDFNCGNEIPGTNLSSEIPESCDLIANYFEDAIALSNPGCTFCSENEIATTSKDRLIDHIYTLGFHTSDERITFKEKVKISVDGKEKMVNLSDHYGVTIKVEK